MSASPYGIIWIRRCYYLYIIVQSSWLFSYLENKLDTIMAVIYNPKVVVGLPSIECTSIHEKRWCGFYACRCLYKYTKPSSMVTVGRMGTTHISINQMHSSVAGIFNTLLTVLTITLLIYYHTLLSMMTICFLLLDSLTFFIINIVEYVYFFDHYNQ